MAFGFGGLIGGLVGSAVSSAIKNNNNKKPSNSSGSSNGSSDNRPSSSGGSSRPSSSASHSSSSGDNTDYQALIDKAVGRGDYAEAAILEQKRNQKIKDQGLSWGTTNKYSQYLPGGSSSGSSGRPQTGTSIQSGSQQGGAAQQQKPGPSPSYSSPYDPGVDLQALIDEAVKNNNLAQAAILEQQRNQKIDSMGLQYGKTNNYTQYLGQPVKNGVSSMFDKNGNLVVDPNGPTAMNTGGGKGVLDGDGSWAAGSAGYNQDFQAYIDRDLKQIAEYEAALKQIERQGGGSVGGVDAKWYKTHLAGLYHDLARQENNRNAKLVAMGRGDLVTNKYQDWAYNANGYEKPVSAIGNGAASMSAEQIGGYERMVARMMNDYYKASNPYQKQQIWQEVAPIALSLGMGWDPKTQQWSASTVTPKREHYGEKVDGVTSHGAWTNGMVNTDADQAVLDRELDKIKAERDEAAANGMYTPDWWLSHGGTRLEGNSSDPNTYMGLTITDYGALYEQAKARGDKAGMEAAHAGAEAIRAQLGYSGGADGSQRIPISTGGNNMANNTGGTGGALPGFGGMTGLVGNIIGGLVGSTMGGDQQQPVPQVPQTPQLPQMPQGGMTGGTLPEDLGGMMPEGSGMGGDMLSQYEANVEQAMKDLMAGQDAAKQQIELGVQQSVNELNSQKGQISAKGDELNAQAEKLYMDSINPNGATAQQLAAMGLRDSGLTESSIISAGNTLQNNIGANKRQVAEQIAKVDLAITNAKLEGNKAVAGILAEYSKAVAEMGMNKAGTVLSFRQWATEFEETKKYNQQQLEMAQKELAMQEQQLAAQQAQAQWEREQAQKELEWKQNQQSWENRLNAQEYQREYVYKMLAQGVLPDHQTIVNAGMNDAEVWEMWKSIKNQLAM